MCHTDVQLSMMWSDQQHTRHAQQCRSRQAESVRLAGAESVTWPGCPVQAGCSLDGAERPNGDADVHGCPPFTKGQEGDRCRPTHVGIRFCSLHWQSSWVCQCQYPALLWSVSRSVNASIVGGQGNKPARPISSRGIPYLAAVLAALLTLIECVEV